MPSLRGARRMAALRCLARGSTVRGGFVSRSARGGCDGSSYMRRPRPHSDRGVEVALLSAVVLFFPLSRSSSVSRHVLRLGIATRAVRARSVAVTKPFSAPPYGGADTRTHAHKDVRCARCARHAYVLSFPPPASVAMRERERHARVANTVSTSAARRHRRVLCLPLRAPGGEQSSRRRAAQRR